MRLEDTDCVDSADVISCTKILADFGSSTLCHSCNLAEVKIDSAILAHNPICFKCIREEYNVLDDIGTAVIQKSTEIDDECENPEYIDQEEISSG